MFLSHLESGFMALVPASWALWDADFIEAVDFNHGEVGRMQAWVKQQISVRNPRTLLVPTGFVGKKS
jgi:hypothetical protein